MPRTTPSPLPSTDRRARGSALAPALDRDQPLVVLARRCLSISLLAVATLVMLGLAPIWVPIAALLDRLLPGGRCTLRCGVFLLHYLVCEWAGLGLALRNVVERALRGDGGTSGEWARLTRLQSMWAGWLLRGAARIFGFTLDVSGEDALRSGSMILMLRHASVADTVLAAVLVTAAHGWPLRYVLKHELLWDPCLDIVGNRLPNYFVRRESNDTQREIDGVVGLLDGLEPGEGILIYPEGTRFSEDKRRRVMRKLRDAGSAEILSRAEGLHNTLPPRLGGVLALLAANPGLDVVLGAHTGFEGAASFWDLWNGALRGAVIRVHFWRVSAEDLPRGRVEGIDWLYREWQRMDDWVGDARAASAAGG